MSETKKLQKAIELTITAGYQLDKEAFEFLSKVSQLQDPTEIMSKAIHKMGTLKEQPLFIGKEFLEQLVQLPEVKEELDTAIFEKPAETAQEPHLTEGKKPFHPYAKEVASEIKTIDDPSSRIDSCGTFEDYLSYFQDRFKRIEKLLRQRMDVRSAASIIDALKAPASTRLKIIGMITEKRESKHKILLTIEDLHASTMVLIPEDAQKELLEKAHQLLLDQVICVSVVKTRSKLLIAEDLIFPDVAQKTQNGAQVPVYAVLTSDMHVGSKKFLRDSFNRFILWLNGKYGDDRLREIASHVKYVLIAGDIVDGIGVYPNQVKELAIKDVYEQYKLAAKYLEQIPDYVDVIIIPGNHDAPRKALPQPAISNTFLETLQEARNIYSLGNPCLTSLHGVKVLLYHGRSLDDIISTVPNMDAEHPEKAMKLLLQCRHLAPVYGGKTMVSAESKDSLVIEQIPDIFHAGHIHVLGYCNYRGVLTVNSGGWQEQTDYMQRLGLFPTPGKVPVVNLQTFEVSVISFT